MSGEAVASNQRSSPSPRRTWRSTGGTWPRVRRATASGSWSRSSSLPAAERISIPAVVRSEEMRTSRGTCSISRARALASTMRPVADCTMIPSATAASRPSTWATRPAISSRGSEVSTSRVTAAANSGGVSPASATTSSAPWRRAPAARDGSGLPTRARTTLEGKATLTSSRTPRPSPDGTPTTTRSNSPRSPTRRASATELATTVSTVGGSAATRPPTPIGSWSTMRTWIWRPLARRKAAMATLLLPLLYDLHLGRMKQHHRGAATLRARPANLRRRGAARGAAVRRHHRNRRKRS